MNQNMTALFTSISTLCKVAGTLMAANGLASTGAYMWIQLVGGSIMVVGPAIYDVLANLWSLRKAQAVGVQAGINLTVAGAALASDGQTVVSKNDGTTPPKPVTVETAAQIVRDFGPTPSAIGKS